MPKNQSDESMPAAFWEGKRLFASPEVMRENPRRKGVAGGQSLDLIRDAGIAGLSYADWHAGRDKGLTNAGTTGHHHLRWDLEHGRIRVVNKGETNPFEAEDETLGHAEERDEERRSSSRFQYDVSPPTTRTDEFRNGLRGLLSEAEARGETRCQIRASHLHRIVGQSSRGAYDEFPMVCTAMWDEWTDGVDLVIHEPPKKKGAALEIVYILQSPSRFFAGRPLTGLVDNRLDEAQYIEGGSRTVERKEFIRNPALVAKAKLFHGTTCMVCGFDFEESYGSLGSGYIECHHIDPVSKREGQGSPTTVQDVVMLCANCHRMIHRKREALTPEELKQLLRPMASNACHQ